MRHADARGRTASCPFRPDAERRRESRVDVRVLHHQRAVGEVRVEVELEPVGEASAQIRPKAADRERVGQRIAAVVQREPPVGLDQQADLKPVVAVVVLDDEPVPPSCRDAGGGAVWASAGAAVTIAKQGGAQTV